MSESSREAGKTSKYSEQSQQKISEMVAEGEPVAPTAKIGQGSNEHITRLQELSQVVRYHLLKATTAAGSGHPSSSLSAADLMTGLLFGGTFRFDVQNPNARGNDRLVFSKGHASPLLYALWLVAGQLSEEQLLSYRQFGSPLEGHPIPNLGIVEAATGSLGQGLSIGVGLSINAKYVEHRSYHCYVLLGDSEMTEGSQWEAMELSRHYQLSNLIGIIDVNGLGQRGRTLHGHDCEAYERRVSAFGWNTITIDGHDQEQIASALERAREFDRGPTMIIARTVKGKGVRLLEGAEGWHGKTLNEDQLAQALADLGPIRTDLRAEIPLPPSEESITRPEKKSTFTAEAKPSGPEATRTAYGKALSKLAEHRSDIVVLDAEVSNSTKSDVFAQEHPDRFFEMYIAEQNMVGVAVGLARRGCTPFVSTFAAFFTRAFDQIRMAAYSQANIKFVGSHAGVSVGQDGPSQMGLEDIAMFRTVYGSVVLQPADAVATAQLVDEAARHDGIVYLRTMRQETPIVSSPDHKFTIGGCQVLASGSGDTVCLMASGATVHSALLAREELALTGILARVIDVYSIKPLDRETLRSAALETGRVVTVEDHYPEGGLGEAVLSLLGDLKIPVTTLAVRQRPQSGTTEELLDFENISAPAIVSHVQGLPGGTPSAI